MYGGLFSSGDRIGDMGKGILKNRELDILKNGELDILKNTGWDILKDTGWDIFLPYKKKD